MRLAMRRGAAATFLGLAVLAAGCGDSTEGEVDEAIDAAQSQADELQTQAEEAIDAAASAAASAAADIQEQAQEALSGLPTPS